MIDPSYEEFLARRERVVPAGERRLAADEYDTSVRRLAALDGGAAPWWPTERADREAEIAADEEA